MYVILLMKCQADTALTKTCYPLRHVYDNAAIQYDCVCQPPQRNMAILSFPQWTMWEDTLPNQHLNCQRAFERRQYMCAT